MPEVLDFLFENPQGEVTVTYSVEVGPYMNFNYFAPGDALATCVFRVSHAVAGEFLIKVQDDLAGLHFDNSSSLWSVTKHLEIVVP